MSYKFTGDVYDNGRGDCGCEDYDVYGGQKDCGCDDYDGRRDREGRSGRNEHDGRGDREGRGNHDGRSTSCNECGRDWECDRYPVLAIATVPMQEWRLTYSPEKALRAGTMFAELHLPFKGGKCR